MKKSLTLALLAATGATLIAAPAAQAQAPALPNTKGLTPHTPECNYMSKPGYLRYQTFITQGRWISFEEASRITTEQAQ